MAHASAQHQSVVFTQAPAKVQLIICKLSAGGVRGGKQQGAVSGGWDSWTHNASYRY